MTTMQSITIRVNTEKLSELRLALEGAGMDWLDLETEVGLAAERGITETARTFRALALEEQQAHGGGTSA